MINIYMKMEHISLFSRLQFIGGWLRAKRKRANTRQQLFYQLNYTRKNGLIKKSITRQKSLGRNS